MSGSGSQYLNSERSFFLRILASAERHIEQVTLVGVHLSLQVVLGFGPKCFNGSVPYRTSRR